MKAVISLACVLAAASGVVQAQSRVSIYGLVDLSYQHLRSGESSPMRGGTLDRLADGVTFGPGSRLGFTALEDLGNGLMASANLEMGLNTDTGTLANGGRGFGRHAFVSLLSPSWGEIRLGRQYTMHDEVMRLTNPFTNATILNPGANANYTNGPVPLFIDTPRIDNAIHYLSPKFGPFAFQVLVAPGEGLVDRYHGIKLAYSDGPLNAATSYELSKARAATPGVSVAGDSVNKIFEAGANYDFGAFRLFGGYQRGSKLTPGSSGIITEPTATNGGVGTQISSLQLPGLGTPANALTAYTLGASMPVGQFLLGTNYTRTTYESTLARKSLGRAGVGAMYFLSKTAIFYTALGAHTGSLKEFVNEKIVFQAGLRKIF
ncbi:porin [Xylophilus sp. ASV27]|uniref:porin n=1 Tax=Xylophilus sp. ASV27 TaxID=2795129 RepID=UPI0018EAD2F4|nr:porin [Xylophilus sp. ASV27]